ncbi:10 kDa chaperonin [Cymbomonas tetramitiformis]|uniref:Protein groES n=1 Tax=Cymbomonas tetramitiformis TaxID=36881 RepID=A0AAE0GPB6_9CHLO|nr:10 kDa chaperonin [Cymbomonas tetramitiformis]
MSAVRRLIPLLDRVLVQKVEPLTKSAGGILLPESSTKMNEGVVVKVGSGGRTRDGTPIPMSVQEGDKVLLPEYGGTPVKLGGDDFTLYRDEDILGILKE